MCESKKSMSANQIKRTIKVSYKTAWYLCHRIRHAMAEVNNQQTGYFGDDGCNCCTIQPHFRKAAMAKDQRAIGVWPHPTSTGAFSKG
jgi:hypothetical protein